MRRERERDCAKVSYEGGSCAEGAGTRAACTEPDEDMHFAARSLTVYSRGVGIE